MAKRVQRIAGADSVNVWLRCVVGYLETRAVLPDDFKEKNVGLVLWRNIRFGHAIFLKEFLPCSLFVFRLAQPDYLQAFMAHKHVAQPKLLAIMLTDAINT